MNPEDLFPVFTWISNHGTTNWVLLNWIPITKVKYAIADFKIELNSGSSSDSSGTLSLYRGFPGSVFLDSLSISIPADGSTTEYFTSGYQIFDDIPYTMYTWYYDDAPGWYATEAVLLTKTAPSASQLDVITAILL